MPQYYKVYILDLSVTSGTADYDSVDASVYFILLFSTRALRKEEVRRIHAEPPGWQGVEITDRRHVRKTAKFMPPSGELKFPV